MANPNKGRTYEEIYGIEKAIQLKETRRKNALSNPVFASSERKKNCKVVCMFCNEMFLAADPKSKRCDKCWKCLDCGEKVKQLYSRYCRKCNKNHPTEKQLQQRARLHAQTRKNNPAKREDVRKKISEGVKRNHPSKLYPEQWKEHASRMRNPKPSKLEDLVAPFLTEFERQFKANFYAIDFANPKEKIAVEIQGCWHHCCSKCYPTAKYPKQFATLRNDSAKRTYLTNKGWKIIYIWEHEIRENAENSIKNNVYNYKRVPL